MVIRGWGWSGREVRLGVEVNLARTLLAAQILADVGLVLEQ